MKGCGKSSDRHHFTVDLQIRGSGVSEDTTFLNRLAFHGQSSQDVAKHRMGSFQEWPSFRGYGVSQSIGISRSICKSKDAAKNRTGPFIFTRVAKLFAHVLRFSHSLLIGQVLAFCNFIFVFHGTVCDWSKPLILKQLHFSFFLANHIKTKLCFNEEPVHKKHLRLSTTSRDASVGLCRKIYFSK